MDCHILRVKLCNEQSPGARNASLSNKYMQRAIIRNHSAAAKSYKACQKAVLQKLYHSVQNTVFEHFHKNGKEDL